MLNIVQLERDRAAKVAEGRALIAAAMETSEAENRAWTKEEEDAIDAISKQGLEIDGKIARLKGQDAMLEQFERLAGSGKTPAAAAARVDRRSMGEQFVQAEQYDFFKQQQHRTSATWRSPSVELFDHHGLHATTLTTDPASGGDLIIPEYRPGIQPLLFRRLTIADLLASGTTDSNLISYMVETVFTNAAAAVLEGDPKPESALVFDAVSDAVRKIAHWLPVTEEMLEDVPQIRSYIDARLRLGVELAEENELWNGTGVAPHILGVTKRAGLAAPYVRVDPQSNADALYIQTMAIYGSSFLMPTAYVLNPVNWVGISLMKTTTGEYLAGGPFSPIMTPTLWGLRVVLTPVQAAGIGWVGAFSTAAQVFRKGGIRVEASNSHQDFFIKNLVAIRAEERLALAVYRPGSIGSVTGLTGAPATLEAGLAGGTAGELGEGSGDTGVSAPAKATSRAR